MNTENCLEIMKALADESRLRIVNSLIGKPQYVEELSQRIGLAASTVSFHLKKLEQAGLACKHKEQYYIVYSVNSDIFDLPLRMLISPVQGNLYEQEIRLENYRKKVLNTFIKNGRLEKIPAQKKKKIIILEYLAKRFKTGIQYSEEDVNNIISSFFDDYCTLRRLMVDFGLFSRNGGLYNKTGKDEMDTETGAKNNNSLKSESDRKMTDRKQIIKDYKATVQPMGIFQLRNTTTGKIYLGSSKNFNSSRNRHFFQLQQKVHPNRELQEEWNTFGEDIFLFEIVDRLEPKEDLSYNYTDDLKTLFELWMEKLSGSGKDVKVLVKHCKM